MLCLKTSPLRLLFPKEGPGSFAGHEFFEASSIRKYDGTYYFVYSSRLNHELCYATSDRPDGGFAFGGTLVSVGDVGLPGHPDERSASNYTGNTHGGMLRLGDDGGVLVDQFQDGDVVQIHLVGLHQGQQQLEGAVEIPDVKGQRRHLTPRSRCGSGPRG